MVSKSNIELIRSLKQKKFRKELGLFIAETPKVVLDLINEGIKPHLLFCINTHLKNWQNIGLDNIIASISQNEIERISSLESPNEIVGVFEIPKCPPFNQPKVTIALDGINDPGNLGTIIRTADWFGFHHLILSPDNADPYNSKAVQASMGSVGRAKFIFSDADTFMNNCLPETKVLGAYLNGTPLHLVKQTDPSIIVIGSEAHGIRKDWEKHINTRVHIPAGKPDIVVHSRAESLNAASAAAILIYHFNCLK